MEARVSYVLSSHPSYLSLTRWCYIVDQTLPPVSRSIIHFYHLRLRLIIDELKLLTLFTPLLGTEQMVMLDCAHSALAILRHVGEDVVPNGYLAYVQEFVPFCVAYAGAWLFKVGSSLSHIEKRY